MLDRNGQLMNARIAKDGQWRFPELDSTPYKFREAIISYEDKTFEEHWGVSLISLARALYQNLSAGEVVSGGSTLTMQVARMSRNSERTLWNKFIEMIWSYRMELRYSKEEIMNMYASHAPFGGNVVGLEAASWRYFGLPPERLSWAQAATLAVLPNAPGLIHPGRNRDLLIEKRNRVLAILTERGKIDSLTYQLALQEPLVEAPADLPTLAPHLMTRLIKEGRQGQRLKSTLDIQKQEHFTSLLQNYQQKLNSNQIHNSALLIVDLRKNEVVTYVGNGTTDVNYARDVDIIRAPRSTGSILKPFLYAALTQEGKLHNEMLIPDIPLRFENFAPKNFENQNDGAVRAGSALARSLNVPAVYLLQEYGTEKFLHLLQRSDLKHIDKSAEHYGLSLILGGAESSLWDIAGVYSGMARTLSYYNLTGMYNKTTWDRPKYLEGVDRTSRDHRSSTHFDAGSIYLILKTLLEVNRPYMESSWKYFSSSKKIAWKTGTSFGHRDAWAVGCTPEYLVAVWVGNASGEGRPEIIGTSAAAPVMFDVFSKLSTEQNWFEPPHDELIKMEICAESGHRSTHKCNRTETVVVHKNARRSTPCNFHQTILTDVTESYQFYVHCSNGYRTKPVSRFVLPPLQAWYYRHSHPEYKPLPPFHPDCESGISGNQLAIIYPENGSDLLATKDLSGKVNGFVFEAAHPIQNARIFWHVDNQFIGTTSVIHTINYLPTPGIHKLTIMDEEGNEASVRFEVLE